MDHPNATITRLWGPVSRLLHRVVVTAGRGHRGGSHDILVAPPVFGGLAAAATLHPVTAAVVLVLVLGIGIRALEYVLPGRLLERGLLNLAAAGTAAWWITTHTAGLAWIPWALALGVATHILGDAVTKKGVPIPFTWLGKRRCLPGGPVSTGGWYERWLIAPALLIAAGALLGLHLNPTIVDDLHQVTTALITEGANTS